MAGQASRRNGLKGGRPHGASKLTREKRAQLQRTRELDAAATTEQIRRGALYDMRRLFGADGNVKPVKELSEADAAMIEGFEVVRRNVTSGDGQTDTVLKYKLAPRAAYVRMAGEIHGLFVERVQISGELTLSAKVAAARRRLGEATGDRALSPASETLTALSPAIEMTVSDANGKAKATP